MSLARSLPLLLTAIQIRKKRKPSSLRDPGVSLELVAPSSVLCFLASFISDTAINAVGLASGVRRASEHNAPFTEFTDDDGGGDAAEDNLEAAMSNKDKKEKCRVPKYAVIERCAASPGG